MGTTLATLRANAQRYADLDNVTTGPVSTAGWATFLNAAYDELWSIVAGAMGDHFLKSEDFTLTAGQTHTLAADFRSARGLDREPNNDYPEPVRPFTWDERNAQSHRAYVLRGGVLEIRPRSLIPGDYRLWYYGGPTTLSADSDEIDDTVDRWHDFVEMRAATYALEKQEQDASFLSQRLEQYVADRIQPAARTRDSGGPKRAVNTREDHLWHLHRRYPPR